MAVIWGFDLSDMSWSAFGHKRMFAKGWYLRRERFIVYQLAMLIGLAAECTATYSLSKYEFHQSRIERLSNYTASVHNNDLIATAIVTIVFCVLVATLFGAEFFFLLFWPRRIYPRWYNITRKALAVFITLGMGGAALSSTVIIARRAVFITGVSQSTVDELTGVYNRPPLIYRNYPQNIAWIVLLWPAFLATAASTVILFRAARHDEEFGIQQRGEDQPLRTGSPINAPAQEKPLAPSG